MSGTLGDCGDDGIFLILRPGPGQSWTAFRSGPPRLGERYGVEVLQLELLIDVARPRGGLGPPT